MSECVRIHAGVVSHWSDHHIVLIGVLLTIFLCVNVAGLSEWMVRNSRRSLDGDSQRYQEYRCLVDRGAYTSGQSIYLLKRATAS